MKSILIVIAHPRQESFNYTILKTITNYLQKEKNEVTIQDLYADKFNPVLTADESLAVQNANIFSKDPLVQTYQQQLQKADLLVIIHPNWWGKPPAIMAGWLDRVLAPGVAYKLNNGAAGLPESLLQLKALVITTSDTPQEREDKIFGDPLANIWGTCVLPYIGATEAQRIHLSPVSAATEQERQNWLKTIESALANLLNKE